jgi:RNA polymerase sigma factor (TIGR02999 family)
MTPESDVTRLLHAVNRGEPSAPEDLYRLVYEELRRLAGARMGSQRDGHTLQPTALVHEAYLRLVGSDSRWQGRAHFFGAAARAMRQVLVDHARRRGARKRGGGRGRISLSDLDPATEARLDDLLALDEALERLAARDRRKASVVELRFFAGLEVDETARALGISPRSVHLDWRFAKAWLFREMTRA